MFSCPHCLFPLTGGSRRLTGPDSCEGTIYCSHCEAIVRVEITTLKEPNPKKLEKHTNKISEGQKDGATRGD